MLNQKQTILYARLSRDDGEDSVSNSIQNQQTLLEKYAEDNNHKPYRLLYDDGISGTVWNRPGWKELISEVEAGRVQTVIVKNLDRMGRDYLRVGLFMEQFRELGIRLIVINDGIDTARGEDDFTPFRAILAEWYAKDTSKKIRAVFKSRTEQGYHCTGSIPYGYIHNPENRQEWLVDEEAAAVVRRIFQLIIEGNGIYQIARILEEDTVLIPTAHWKSSGQDCNVRHHNFKDPYRWSGGVVNKILQREEYMGNKILRKNYSESYKHKRKATPKEERLVFEGAIPQIITPEMWNNAQRLRRTVRRPAKSGEPPYRLTGLMFCETCGAKMTHDRGQDYSGKGKHKNDYLCPNYRKGTRECTMHYIRVPVVEGLILDTIRKVSYYVCNHESEFIEKVSQAFSVKQESAISDSKKRLSKHKRRRDEIDGLIKTLYESFATGKIPEKHFENLLANYDGEQTSLAQQIAVLQAEVDEHGANIIKTDKFIELVKRYTDFDELSNKMVNEFIDKIIVHEADRSTGKRVQRVDIYLNFIGNFVLPIQILPSTAKEIERQKEAERIAAEKAKQRKIKSREKSRAWREKVKGTAYHEECLTKRRAEYAEKKKQSA